MIDVDFPMSQHLLLSYSAVLSLFLKWNIIFFLAYKFPL